MIFVLLFLFQFSMVLRDRQNTYDVNSNLAPKQNDGKNVWKNEELDLASVGTTDRRYVLFVGDSSSGMAEAVSRWCTYAKWDIAKCSSMEKFKENDKNLPGMLILESEKYALDDNLKKIEELEQKGVIIVFGCLEDPKNIEKNQELQDFMGICKVVSGKTEITGVKLFEGLLLGGEVVYETPEDKDERDRQDLQLNVPWYQVGSGTKTYMVGTLSDETIEQTVENEIRAQYAGMEEEAAKNSLLPAILWRNSVDTAKIFCVNGDYLADISAVGILDAMMGETYDYDIYPVINAQNLVIADLPTFVSENEEEMQKCYSQSAQAVYQEIVWPSLTSIASRTGAKMTCMMTPQFTYTDEEEPDGENVTYYLKRLKEEHAEAGLSADSMEGIPLSEKIKQDQTFWQTYAPSYRFLSLYADGVKSIGEKSALPAEIRTVALGSGASGQAVGYLNENVTLQPSTSSGIRHTFLDDFKVKCMETALGYSNITLDLYSVTYPEGDEDSWEKMSKKIAANLGTYWKAYEAFDATTLTESDVRIRRFLALDYKQQRAGNVITLSLEHREDAAWFLLRLHGEKVTEVAGGSFEEIEDGVYLILAEEDEVSVEVQTGETWQYQDGGKRGDGT